MINYVALSFLKKQCKSCIIMYIHTVKEVSLCRIIISVILVIMANMAYFEKFAPRRCLCL